MTYTKKKQSTIKRNETEKDERRKIKDRQKRSIKKRGNLGV